LPKMNTPQPFFFSQLPPYFNFGSLPEVHGWTVVLAIIQLIWLPEDVSGNASQSDDWMVCLGEDMSLVASLALWLETTPCVSLGTLLASRDVKDMAAAMQAQVKVSEASPLGDWEENGMSARSGRPLGVERPEEDLSLVESENEDELSQDVPPVPTPRTASPATRKRNAEAVATPPKPRTKTCTRPSAPKPSAAAPMTPAPAPKPSQAPSSASSLSRRLQTASGLRKH
jgi:hypothetical protein